MKKFKPILTGLICVACVAAIIFLLINRDDGSTPDTTQPTNEFVDSDTYTLPSEETPEVPEWEIYVMETFPASSVGEYVTIDQVPADPNEVIDRTPEVPEDHPEYIGPDEQGQYQCSEGKVFRNDKTISIRIQDKALGNTYDISFGYITGTCNRFLYLNPVVERNGATEDYYIWFDIPQGGGSVYTLSSETDAATASCYTFTRALEERTCAQYLDPKNPGAVWFPRIPIEEGFRPIYIDTLVYSNAGVLVASVRLTIEQSEADGTYSITDLDDNNLLSQNENYPKYTEDELSYILTVASEAYADPDQVAMYPTILEDTFSPEKCIIDYRPYHAGFYFDEFIPLPGGYRSTAYYLDADMDTIAVTYRLNSLESHTMYFQVLFPPQPGTESDGSASHGIYRYIGRDYPNIITKADLEVAGWNQYP